MAELTQKQMIERMWLRIEGHNGDGMADKLDQLWELRHSYLLHDEYNRDRKEASNNRRSNLSKAREVAQWVLTLLVGGGVVWRLFG